MPKNKKYALEVVFGEEASSYAGYFGFAKANKKIKQGELEGFAAVFQFDTENDRNTAIEMIGASDGWLGTYWQKK